MNHKRKRSRINNDTTPCEMRRNCVISAVRCTEAAKNVALRRDIIDKNRAPKTGRTNKLFSKRRENGRKAEIGMGIAIYNSKDT